MISVRFQGKPFNITVIQVHAPTSNAEEAEVERFYEDLQDLLELTHPKKCPFHYRGLECKSRNQETPGVAGKFGLGMRNEAGQRLIEFCQENVLVIDNTMDSHISQPVELLGFQSVNRRHQCGAPIWHCSRSASNYMSYLHLRGTISLCS